MVAEKQDQARIVKLTLFQPCNHAPQFMVRVRNLSVVLMTLIPAAKRFRRIVRAVRIVQMQPEKKWPPRMSLQPRQRTIDTFSRLPVNESEIAVDEGFRSKRVVVKVESPRQSP